MRQIAASLLLMATQAVQLQDDNVHMEHIKFNTVMKPDNFIAQNQSNQIHCYQDDFYDNYDEEGPKNDKCCRIYSDTDFGGKMMEYCFRYQDPATSDPDSQIAVYEFNKIFNDKSTWNDKIMSMWCGPEAWAEVCDENSCDASVQVGPNANNREIADGGTHDTLKVRPFASYDKPYGGHKGGKATIYDQLDCWGRSEVLHMTSKINHDKIGSTMFNSYQDLDFLYSKGWFQGNIRSVHFNEREQLEFFFDEGWNGLSFTTSLWRNKGCINLEKIPSQKRQMDDDTGRLDQGIRMFEFREIYFPTTP